MPLYDTEKPFQIFINIPDDATDKRTTNLAFENVKVEVQDVRQFPTTHFQLNQHGFTYCSHHLQPDQLMNQTSIEDLYLPEMESLIRVNLEDVDRVFFFDWRVGFVFVPRPGN